MDSPLKPIDHPSAWRGAEVEHSAEWNLALDASEVDELLASADVPVTFDTPIESDGSLAAFPILAKKLALMQDRLEHGTGVVRLTGFPASGIEAIKAKTAFWNLCRHVGTPISQSASGDRLFDVRDAGFAADDQRARGPNTRKKLSFHTDRCDVIAFLCYRQAKQGGENLVVSSVSLFNAMLEEREDLVKVLMQPYRYQRHNVDTANEKPYVEQPIFSIHEGHFAANLLRVLIERAYAAPETPDMSDEQREALDYLESLASQERMHVRFRQQDGHMLLLNNWVTFHRRTEFVDHEDDERKRHLFRIWLSVPNSRALSPYFAGNYGAVEAGALRGGMHKSMT